MINPEKNHSPENNPATAAENPETQAAPDLKAADRMFAARTEMLTSVERHLPVGLREKLRRKITAERERLAALLTQGRKPAPARQAAGQVLNRAFFELKALEINFFE